MGGKSRDVGAPVGRGASARAAAWVVFLLLSGCLWLVGAGPVAALACGALVGLGIGGAVYRARPPAAAVLELSEKVRAHRPALLRNLDRAVKRDDYGTVTADTTEAAIDAFLVSVGLPTGLYREDAHRLVREELDRLGAAARARGFDPSTIPADPTAFERWVADAFQSAGWEARTTAGGADQGIDVIAWTEDLSVGLQCKLYSRAVGNKAVQEALAGAAFHGLDVAAVVSNATFTQSARALAARSGVLLLHIGDLGDPDRVFRRAA